MGLPQPPQPSRLVADHSALLPVLQLYPLAMSFVYGADPDSHLLGGWQLDPNKLNILPGFLPSLRTKGGPIGFQGGRIDSCCSIFELF